MKIHIIGLLLLILLSWQMTAQCPQDTLDCQDVIYVGNESQSGTVPAGTHSSEILLHSDGTVNGTSTVDYESNYVRLDIGFSTEVGADFSAVIEPCTDTPVEEPPLGRVLSLIHI